MHVYYVPQNYNNDIGFIKSFDYYWVVHKMKDSKENLIVQDAPNFFVKLFP